MHSIIIKTLLFIGLGAIVVTNIIGRRRYALWAGAITAVLAVAYLTDIIVTVASR